MQNRYTADIGDFGKYGMLRRLVLNDIKLGVNWYLVPDESHNDDGKFISYLDDSRACNVKSFKTCDPDLYKCMQVIIMNNKRSVSDIQNRGVLPSNTVFYDDILSFQDITDTYERKIFRNHWFINGLHKLKECDIVFFDPDNGLEVPSYSPTSSKGIKYVFYNEIKEYYDRGQSIIIYNHRDRKPEQEYLMRIRKIREYVDIADMFFLRFNRFSVRDYIFILQLEHTDFLSKRIQDMMNSNWSQNFKLLNV